MKGSMFDWIGKVATESQILNLMLRGSRRCGYVKRWTVRVGWGKRVQHLVKIEDASSMAVHPNLHRGSTRTACGSPWWRSGKPERARFEAIVSASDSLASHGNSSLLLPFLFLVRTMGIDRVRDIHCGILGWIWT